MAKTLEPGTELAGGKYRVLRLLGQGGTGSVFEAEQRDTHERVAIKCLHPVLAADPEIAERLVREAQATARVQHPNVVDVYDVCCDGDLVYWVMPYVEGETLAQVLLRRDLAVHQIIALLLPAIRGVDAAHKQGVIHRDLKPDNILIARGGDGDRLVPKVLGFGVSKLELHGTHQRRRTTSGVAVGRPSYMSNEQLAGEPDLDARADVYAFGAILYEALTGKVPYEANTLPELVVRFATQVPPEPKALRPELPTALSRVVMWAIERDRRDRFATLEALALELEPFATRHGYDAERTLPTALVPPMPVPPAKDSQSRALPRRDKLGRIWTQAPSPSRSRTRQMLIRIASAVLLMAALGFLLARRAHGRDATQPVTRAALEVAPASDFGIY